MEWGRTSTVVEGAGSREAGGRAWKREQKKKMTIIDLEGGGRA